MIDSAASSSIQLLEPDISGILAETLAAHVQVVFPIKFNNQISKRERARMEPNLMRPCPLVQHLHFLEPWPYFLGRLNQMFSCPMVTAEDLTLLLKHYKVSVRFEASEGWQSCNRSHNCFN